MKKILAIVMMSLMMVSAAACGNKNETPAPETPGAQTPADNTGDKGEERTLKIAGLDGGYKTEHWKN